MSDTPRLLTDAELAAIVKQDANYSRKLGDRPTVSLLTVVKLLNQAVSDRAVLLRDLLRYRAWCQQLVECYQGDGDIFSLIHQIQDALEESGQPE